MRLDNKCDFCKFEKDNYVHLFYKCEQILIGQKLRDG